MKRIALLFLLCILIPIGALALPGSPPVADFTANVTDVCTNAPIQFVDQSSNAPTAWKWSFGNGVQSALQNPVYAYPVAGIYDVSLKVMNTFGSDTTTRHSYINVTDCTPELTWCDRNTLFFQHAPSTDIPGYEQLINYPSGAAEVDENVTVKNTLGWVLIDTYISPYGSPNVELVLKGLRRYRTYNYVSSATGTTVINYTFFKRSVTGVETTLYSVSSADINDLVVAEQLTSYALPTDMVLNKTDRVGVKLYGSTTHSSNIFLHFVYEGTTHNSHLESGYYVCDPTPTPSGSNGGGGEATGIVFGLIGGLIASIICCRKVSERLKK